MLKVGDKVRVREDLEKVTTPVMVKKEMVKLEGKEDLGGWCWTEEMFEKIEEKENNNMKELTFREVIANIKEGEVWERVDGEYISNRIELKNGQLRQYNFWNGKMGFTLKEAGVIFDKTLYKLKRPQYTFQEAFKAFEEGKEIESCESGDIYNTMEENVEDKLFYGYEIQGKWYIND